MNGGERGVDEHLIWDGRLETEASEDRHRHGQRDGQKQRQSINNQDYPRV